MVSRKYFLNVGTIPTFYLSNIIIGFWCRTTIFKKGCHECSNSSPNASAMVFPACSCYGRPVPVPHHHQYYLSRDHIVPLVQPRARQGRQDSPGHAWHLAQSRVQPPGMNQGAGVRLGQAWSGCHRQKIIILFWLFLKSAYYVLLLVMKILCRFDWVLED